MYCHLENWIGVEVHLGEVRDFLVTVMRGGAHRARLALRHGPTKRRVDFVKLAPSWHLPAQWSTTQFRMELQRKWCSHEEFERAFKLLESAGMGPQVQFRNWPSGQTLLVECGPDLRKTEQVVRVVLLDVFGLEPDGLVRAGIKGGFDISWGAAFGWDSDAREVLADTMDVDLRRGIPTIRKGSNVFHAMGWCAAWIVTLPTRLLRWLRLL
ncbi:MAG: hypothetical protein ACYS8L_08045 [Planctomycetota bacterium]